MRSWTQAICARCFDHENPGRVPVRVIPGRPEVCCLCGERTSDGIYWRVDPRTVPYPRLQVEESHE